MINPIIKLKGTHCSKCNKETVIAYDINNRPIQYANRPNVAISDIMKNINNTTLSYMKCRNCNERYIIDYSLGYARPITYSKAGEFFL